MRLLILTQKIDINDDVLGFFHGWLEKFAQKFEKIIVVCLQKGEYDLPNNVKVLSLGKPAQGCPTSGREKLRVTRYALRVTEKLKYLFNFFRHIWRERKNYDAIFVHMNQEYAILGGLFWKLSGKKIFLWRNHKIGDFLTSIACVIADMVFYTSPFAFVAKFKNARIMPAGIDTERFSAIGGSQARGGHGDLGGKIQNTILSLGRISPVKNLEILIEAAKLLDAKGADFILDIFGEPDENGKNYFEKIKKMSAGLESKIKFKGAVPNYKTPEIYNQHEIFVNLTNSGSFDKTILEAISCGCIPVVCNKSFEKVFTEKLRDILIFKENDSHDLARKIVNLHNLPEEKKNETRNILRKTVEKEHGLDKLAEELSAIMNKQ